MSRERGFALVLVLWVLVLLGALAAAVAGSTRTEASLTRNGTDAALALGAAEAGIKTAVERLLRDPAGGATDEDGVSRLEIDVVGLTVRIAVRDACGRVDLNEAPPPLLAAAFAAAGIQRAAPLVDRVTERRRRRRFDTEATVPIWLGLDPLQAGRWLELVTVHCRQAGLDPRVAARALLEQLPGIDPGAVEQMLERRAAPVEAPRSEVPSPAFGPAQYLLLTSNRLSHVIDAEAVVPGGATERLRVVVSLSPGAALPFAFLDWRRGGPG